jgi:hypothetical protein
MAQRIAPGLDGFLAQRRDAAAEQQAEMQGIMGFLRLKQAQEEAAQRAQMQPLQMELIRAQIAERQAASQSAPARAQMEMELKRAQLEKAQREGQQAQVQQQAQMGLAGLLGGNFAPNLTGVMTDENQAREAAIAADRSGQQVNIGVPNPANVQALSVLANPQRAIPELLKQQRPQTANESPIARVMRERASLPPGDPRGPLMDKYIEKLSSHQPGVAVYSGSLTPGVDAQGNPVFVQPSNREGVEPRVVQGVRPMPKPADEKAAQAEREAQATVESVRTRIQQMSQQLQQNPALVGPGGIARRTFEAGAGVVAPSIQTPALDYQNNLRLLLADVRKVVEKDPNLSNQERQALYESLGGGTFQTPGSALRALNNVMEFVERKKLTGPSRRGPAVGTMQQGYRFKGGDPASPQSWEKVQ